MDKRAILIASLLFTGCAVGYANEHRAVGVVLGNSEISSCSGADMETVKETVEAISGGPVEIVPDCPRVKGGTISITAGGVITTVVSFLAGWIMP